ncbi:MAG: tetratricopeptide repeat protein [Desulfovibrio sp.]|nr:tetratricopeptide repeat protein [Desulfovibrio sp.]
MLEIVWNDCRLVFRSTIIPINTGKTTEAAFSPRHALRGIHAEYVMKKKHSDAFPTEQKSDQGKSIKRQTAFLGMFAFFLAGLLLGTVVSDFSSHTSSLSASKTLSKTQESPKNQSEPASRSFQNEIAALESAVAKNPSDQSSWIALGNIYFDANKPTEAITAYEKALTLGSPSADVLTDLGIMYRQIHRFEDAVFAFRQAKNLDPKHLQSRLNEGIVLFYDLAQKDEALRVWEETLALQEDICFPNGEALSTLVNKLKNSK